MAYTPELTFRHSCTLRRIAWAAGTPMTKTLTEIIEHIAGRLNADQICESCKDRTKCRECMFKHSK